MASPPHGLGLSARVSDFSDALFGELGLKLDRKEGYYDDEDDHWSRLVDKLGLGADKKRARLRENKTEWILRRWSHEKPDESTGRRLVEILNDLGRRDASLVVQCHLGEEYRPERKEMDDLFEAIDNAARFNDVKRLGELINDTNVSAWRGRGDESPQSPICSSSRDAGRGNRKGILHETVVSSAFRCRLRSPAGGQVLDGETLFRSQVDAGRRPFVRPFSFPFLQQEELPQRNAACRRRASESSACRRVLERSW